MSSPNLSHARMLVEGLLAQIDKEYGDGQRVGGSVTKSPAIVVVSDLQDSLAPFDPRLDIRFFHRKSMNPSMVSPFVSTTTANLSASIFELVMALYLNHKAMSLVNRRIRCNPNVRPPRFRIARFRL